MPGGVLPDRDAVIRLLGAVRAEQHDAGAEGRRFLGLDVLARRRLRPVPDPATEPTGEEVTAPATGRSRGGGRLIGTPARRG